MTAFNWSRTAFVWVSGNVPFTLVPEFVTTLFVPVAFGAGPSPQQPSADWLDRAGDLFTIAAWAWGTGEDPELEAGYHASAARAIGAAAFVANLEEAYDAHGYQNDPRYHLPGAYLAALDFDGPIGLTTTPRFGSDMTPWVNAGAVVLPQSFPTAGEGGDPVHVVYDHFRQWGWPGGQIRPLVQTYAGPSGWPNQNAQALDAAACGVGVTPYTLEQGYATLDPLRAAIEFATSGAPAPEPAPEPEPDEPDWWTVPYPRAAKPAYSGKMPRPLYPPDSAEQGKRPSMDGEDVLAIKWAVKMAQRWAKDKTRDQLDDTFSNGFSHGTGGNVAETGLAGLQRQQGIDDTGWMGQKTFDALNWSLCPAGPNRGKPLFDATAVKQLQRAWDRFQGKEPPPPAPDSRQLALDHLAARLGYTEQPDGSNCDSRPDGIRTAQDHTAGGGTWLRYQPWCGCWCYYALEAAGVERIDSSLASVASIEDYARAGQKCYRGWTTDRTKVKPGDLVIVGGYGVHVETVRAKPASDGSVPTYGGNTSPGTEGSQANGGGAYARTRYPSEIRGFALVRYPGE